MTRLGKPLVFALWLSMAAHAQDLAPPPLLTVEQDEPEPPPPLPSEQPPSPAVLQPPTIANPPLEPPQEVTMEEPPGRGLRIGMGLVFGAAAGAAGGLAGGLLGGGALPDSSLQPLGATWTGAAIGFGLLAPLGVVVSGWLFDGDGSFLATLLGDAVGAAVGAAAVWLGGTSGTPLLFTLPLLGSVLGYEVTSPSAKSMVKVSASVTPLRDGALLGLAGAF